MDEQETAPLYLKSLSDKYKNQIHKQTYTLTLCLSAIYSSLDDTFKASNKATLTNKDRQKTREITYLTF